MSKPLRVLHHSLLWLACTLPNATLAAESEPEIGGDTGLGYLTTPSSSPGHILRPSSIFQQRGDAHEGELDGALDVHWANVWCYDHEHYLLDGEWTRIDTRLQYGLSDVTSAGIILPVIGRTGGWADSSIESFHNTLNLGNKSREQFAQNQSTVWFKDADGTTNYLVEGDSWGIGDIEFYAVSKESRLWASPSFMIQCSLPTGNKKQFEGLGSPALSISAVGTKQLGRSPANLFGGLGASYCPEDEFAGVQFHPLVYSGLLGAEYRLDPALSLVLQVLYSSPVAKNFGEFSDPCYELSTGCKWRSGRATVWEVAMVENLFKYRNSADIAVHFSVGRDF